MECPPNTAHELALGHDELLAEQAVLGDECRSSTEQIGGETGEEPSDISHGGFFASIGDRIEFGRGRDGPCFAGSGRPPHRSEHAELPHSAPALGSIVEEQFHG